MKHEDLFVWLQTTVRRDSSKTRASIEASDIGNRYTTAIDTNFWKFPADYPKLQLWWEEHMLKMADLALANNCLWMLRLEDDIVVNKHIVHNVSSWPALNDPFFGIGTLFYPNYWERIPWAFKKSKHSGEIFRDSKSVEGAQGQLIRADRVHELIPLTRKARAQKLRNKPTDVSFDWSISRAAFLLGHTTYGAPLRTFVHEPSLVDVHQESCNSLINNIKSDPKFHYWGDHKFDASWKRRV